MSHLHFDGKKHEISLVDDKAGKQTIVGTWPAYNNVDSHATLTHLQNGTYKVQDRLAPHRHKADSNGPYGSHGIIRFDVSGHPGIGLHSGRANARRMPGPPHPTMGCIRTSDEAMMKIANFMRTSPLTSIEITNNSASAAKFESRVNRNANLHGSSNHL